MSNDDTFNPFDPNPDPKNTTPARDLVTRPDTSSSSDSQEPENADDDGLDKLKVGELRERADKAGVDSTGTKADLIERIRAG